MTQPAPRSKYAYWRLIVWTCLGFAMCHLSMQSSESNSIVLRLYRETVLPTLESVKESVRHGLIANHQPEKTPADN